MYQVFNTYHFRQPPIKYTFLTIHFEGNAACVNLVWAPKRLSVTYRWQPNCFQATFSCCTIGCNMETRPHIERVPLLEIFFFFSKLNLNTFLGLYLVKQPCKTCGWREINMNIGNRILYLWSRCETLKSNSCQAIKKRIKTHCYTCMLHPIFCDLTVLKIQQNNCNGFFILSITK